MKKLEFGKCHLVNYIKHLMMTNWPRHIDLNNDILLTAGVGNSSYPSSVRIWDLNKTCENQHLIYLMMVRFMHQDSWIQERLSRQLIMIKTFGYGILSTGKPIIDPVKNIYNVALSNNGYYAHKSGESLILSRIPKRFENRRRLLPDFIESVAGKSWHYLNQVLLKKFQKIY